MTPFAQCLADMLDEIHRNADAARAAVDDERQERRTLRRESLPERPDRPERREVEGL